MSWLPGFRPDHRTRRPPRAGAVKAGRHFVRKAPPAFPGRALTAASTAAPSVGRAWAGRISAEKLKPQLR
jgi:hypothetical protein